MLCDLKDSLGVQGLNPDWEARLRLDIRARVIRIIDTVKARKLC